MDFRLVAGLQLQWYWKALGLPLRVGVGAHCSGTFVVFGPSGFSWACFNDVGLRQASRRNVCFKCVQVCECVCVFVLVCSLCVCVWKWSAIVYLLDPGVQRAFLDQAVPFPAMEKPGQEPYKCAMVSIWSGEIELSIRTTITATSSPSPSEFTMQAVDLRQSYADVIGSGSTGT